MKVMKILLNSIFVTASFNKVGKDQGKLQFLLSLLRKKFWGDTGRGGHKVNFKHKVLDLGL